MDMRKAEAILVAMILAFGLNFMYSSSVVYWDAYAYEVTPTSNIDPNYTMQLTSQDLATYPDLAAKLDEANQGGMSMMSFDEGNSFYQYEDLVDSRLSGVYQDVMFLQTDAQSYAVSYTTYDGMDDQPIYLWLSWLAGLIAVGLALSEGTRFLKKN